MILLVLDKEISLFKLGLLIILQLFMNLPVWSGEVRLGVSQSIQSPLMDLCHQFEQKTPHRCKIIFSSTGHLYAQGMHSNVFDAIIGSNLAYTRGLLSSGRGNSSQHFVLAKSRVVLWSSDQNLSSETLLDTLLHNPDVRVVIPEPTIANYGGAVKSILQALNIWMPVQKRLIIANSIPHSYELLSQNKQYIGFTALSQLKPREREEERFWEPEDVPYGEVLHDILAFNEVLDNKAVTHFLDFILDADACSGFEKNGYACWHKNLNS